MTPKTTSPNTRVQKQRGKTKNEFALFVGATEIREKGVNFVLGPQGLKPATSLGWHKQGPFRGPVGKMSETGKNAETKNLRN